MPGIFAQRIARHLLGVLGDHFPTLSTIKLPTHHLVAARVDGQPQDVSAPASFRPDLTRAVGEDRAEMSSRPPHIGHAPQLSRRMGGAQVDRRSAPVARLSRLTAWSCRVGRVPRDPRGPCARVSGPEGQRDRPAGHVLAALALRRPREPPQGRPTESLAGRCDLARTKDMHLGGIAAPIACAVPSGRLWAMISAITALEQPARARRLPPLPFRAARACARPARVA